MDNFNKYLGTERHLLIWALGVISDANIKLMIIYYAYILFVIRISKTIHKTHSYHPSDLIDGAGTIYVGHWRLQTLAKALDPDAAHPDSCMPLVRETLHAFIIVLQLKINEHNPL